jgi:hypothetical protein
MCYDIEQILSQAPLHTIVIPALGKQRQEDCKFEVTLGYIVGPFSNNKKPNQVSIR